MKYLCLVYIEQGAHEAMSPDEGRALTLGQAISLALKPVASVGSASLCGENQDNRLHEPADV